MKKNCNMPKSKRYSIINFTSLLMYLLTVYCCKNILNLTKERKTYFLRQEHVMPLRSRVCPQIVFRLPIFKLFRGQGGFAIFKFLW